jgi:hypothetical protein
VFLGTGAMVVCFKHVGITDSEVENVSEDTFQLVSACCTRPCNPSGPATL